MKKNNISCMSINISGNIGKAAFQYGDNGKAEKCIVKDKKGNIIYEFVYKYNDEDKLTEVSRYTNIFEIDDGTQCYLKYYPGREMEGIHILLDGKFF